jgi:hypothetical protein
MFGLTNSEGNHGEDVKEYWFYLDSTPTHSYLKCLYKYPQREFPYLDVVSTNSRRSKFELEYELLDTGIFDEDRYFDVVVEYAKQAHDDILMRVTAYNRGPDAATLHLLPTLWYRNTWSWGDEVQRTSLKAVDSEPGVAAVSASHPELGEWVFRADGSAQLLFCENETNSERVLGAPNRAPYVKDGVNEFVVGGKTDAVNPDRVGTKVAAQHVVDVPPGDSVTIRLRLTKSADETDRLAPKGKPLETAFDKVFDTRLAEADRYYETVIPPTLLPDGANVMRQALAGLLWGKQYYEYDVHRWLKEHHANPWDPNAPSSSVRNVAWFTCSPATSSRCRTNGSTRGLRRGIWHSIARRCRSWTSTSPSSNGQVPAYEWNFSDVNPPVTAWAALYVYDREAEIRGDGDREFLARVFDRLLLNFTWWVNRKDPCARSSACCRSVLQPCSSARCSSAIRRSLSG